MSKAENGIMNYTKGDKITIVRRKHKISFTDMDTVRELIEILKSLPPDATVDEVIGCDGIGQYGNQISTIEFHEESYEN